MAAHRRAGQGPDPSSRLVLKQLGEPMWKETAGSEEPRNLRPTRELVLALRLLFCVMCVGVPDT